MRVGQSYRVVVRLRSGSEHLIACRITGAHRRTNAAGGSLSIRMETLIDHTEDRLSAWLRREAPINMARAYQVMEQQGLDGLVLGDPLNLFHALGHWPQMANTKSGQPPTSFALLARNPNQPTGLVTSRFLYYYTFADGQMSEAVQAWLYTENGDAGDFAPVADIDYFPDRAAAPLTPVEQRRRRLLDAAVPSRRSFRDAGAALVKAMQAMDLWRGRIAFDHPVIAAVCARHEHPGMLVPGDNILRAIRIVKSPLEIALMRRASAANVAAVGAVGASIRQGASYADLRHVFDVEAAKRGNRAVFMTVDRVSSPLSDERISDGQTLFIDGVSHYSHYHGDYARTVFVGDPTREAKRAADAVSFGWNAVREILRPGLRYSEIAAIGAAAVKKAGFAEIVGFGPHSVGLMHTDEPGEDAGGFYRKADLVLAENMIVSVDCPVMDTGIGGSAHIEDLMLITADGAEPIHDIGQGVMTI